MTGSDQASRAKGPGWQRPAPGGLVAAAGGAMTLTSLFLPWYTLRLSATNFASVSIFAQIHGHGGDRYFSCDPIKPMCRESLTAGALVAGIWDWRTLIAIGAAAVVLYVVIRAQSGTGLRQWPDWQVLVALGGGTAAVAAIAAVVSPVSVTQSALPLRLSSSVAYGAAIGVAGALAALIGGLMLWWTERASEGARLSAPIPQA
jgi:hypothetical protein